MLFGLTVFGGPADGSHASHDGVAVGILNRGRGLTEDSSSGVTYLTDGGTRIDVLDERRGIGEAGRG